VHADVKHWNTEGAQQCDGSGLDAQAARRLFGQEGAQQQSTWEHDLEQDQHRQRQRHRQQQQQQQQQQQREERTPSFGEDEDDFSRCATVGRGEELRPRSAPSQRSDDRGHSRDSHARAGNAHGEEPGLARYPASMRIVQVGLHACSGRPPMPKLRGKDDRGAASELEALRSEVEDFRARLQKEEITVKARDAEIQALRSEVRTVHGRSAKQLQPLSTVSPPVQAAELQTAKSELQEARRKAQQQEELLTVKEREVLSLQAELRKLLSVGKPEVSGLPSGSEAERSRCTLEAQVAQLQGVLAMTAAKCEQLEQANGQLRHSLQEATGHGVAGNLPGTGPMSGQQSELLGVKVGDCPCLGDMARYPRQPDTPRSTRSQRLRQDVISARGFRQLVAQQAHTRGA